MGCGCPATRATIGQPPCASSTRPAAKRPTRTAEAAAIPCSASAAVAGIDSAAGGPVRAIVPPDAPRLRLPLADVDTPGDLARAEASPLAVRRLLRATLPALPAAGGPPVLILTTYDTQADVVAAVEAGAMGYLLKDAPAEQLADALRKVHRGGRAIDPQLALDLGCDGVHIGQEDAPYALARKTLGPARIIGVTCHDSRHLAMEAGEKGADYVAFGAFFPTATKAAKSASDPELIEWWSELFEIPCVAIGGITVDNAAPLIAAGADYLAVSGGIWNHAAGPVEAVRAFARLVKA